MQTNRPLVYISQSYGPKSWPKLFKILKKTTKVLKIQNLDPFSNSQFGPLGPA